jgi:16S rRNA (cytidine1402-2'-O)-methyltransferase
LSDPSFANPPSTADAHDTANPAQIRPAIQPGLTLVATPIGNMADMSWRGIAALRAAELVLCEDTRTTARLFAVHNISSRAEALHEHNEDARIPGLLERLARGAAIALVSDAGTPLMSDPGYRLVRAAIAAGVPVHAVPGANAALMALVLSGLPPHPFLFMGFLPAKPAARRAALAGLAAAERAGLSATLVFYEAPHRLAESLADMAGVLGERPAAVARELTKRFEEVRRDGLSALAALYAGAPARGEICVVVGPPDPAAAADAPADIDALLRAALAEGSLKEAVAKVTAATGLPRKAVYARALEVGRLDRV